MAAGASGVLVGGAVGSASSGVPDGPASAAASAACGLGELLLGDDEGLLRVDGGFCAVERVVAGIGEVGARHSDVADGGRGVVQHVAVPIERVDVVPARPAELLRRGVQLGLGARHRLLLRGDLRLRPVDAGRALGAAGEPHHDDDRHHGSCKEPGILARSVFTNVPRS